jgi:hypothetical protein
MIRKFLLLVLLAATATAAVLALQSRDEIARYRALREM